MTALNTLLLLLTAAAVPGAIERTRALLAGRRGIRFLQHLHDVRLLLRKGSVRPTSTTALFRTAPSVHLAAAIVAALFVPVGDLPALLSFDGDPAAFACTLALGRFALLLAAMDTGSAFAGMGASRKALYGALVEPALLLAVATPVLLTGVASFAGISAHAADEAPQHAVALLLAAFVMLEIVLIESGRIPIDDPRTHLELTMIHEAMCLDCAGVDLAMIKIAGWLETASLSLLAADLAAAPLGGRWWIAAPLAVALGGVSAGVVESVRARNRLVRNTTFILTVAALSALVFLTAYLLRANLPSA